MTDREIVTGYKENVIAFNCIRHGIEWNTRHGLPVDQLVVQLRVLKGLIMRFESILETIQDLRTRNVLRCRYALGMNERDTADYMGLSRGTVARITRDTLERMDC